MRSLLSWFLATAVIVNTGVNLAVLSFVSRVYAIEDFRPDTASRSIQNKIRADNISLPSVQIIKFISAYAYDKPSYVVFTGKNLFIFINFKIADDLSDQELESVLAHEIGHYVLGHLNFKPGLAMSEDESYSKEIQADAFASKYSGVQAISSSIQKLAWDPSERDTRLNALASK